MIERRNGDVKVTRYEGGARTVLADVPHSPRRAQAKTISGSNGFIGDETVYRNMLKLDHELGVGDNVRYIKTHESSTPQGKKVAAYRAEFLKPKLRSKWLKAHHRVDYEAGYGDPCPGDFRGKVPHEFGE